MTTVTEPALAPIQSPSSVPFLGRRRILGRITSLVTVAVALALTAAAIPAQIAVNGTVCAVAKSCVSGQLTPKAAAILRQYGVSPHAFAIASTNIAIGSSLTWFAAGAILLWRRADNRMAVLLGIQAFTQGITPQSAINAPIYFTDQRSTWFLLAFAIRILNLVLLFYLFALFPSGHFVPRWMRWAAIAWVPMQLIGSLPGWSWLSQLLFIAALPMLVGCQIYRYRRVSDSIQRQQTKVIVAAFSTMVVVSFVINLPPVFIPSLGGPNDLYGIVLGIAMSLVLLLAPIATVVAIMRYRLFDIDVLINRTLVYGSLSAVLAAVYFACIIGAQAATQALTGQTSPPPVIIVLSTLLIAALFNPLRHRIQVAIDRRFYRTKYDAQKTLATFGATLRTETDLSSLSNHLVAVVDETMQPTHVSLWLRPMPRETMQ